MYEFELDLDEEETMEDQRRAIGIAAMVLFGLLRNYSQDLILDEDPDEAFIACEKSMEWADAIASLYFPEGSPQGGYLAPVYSLDEARAKKKLI